MRWDRFGYQHMMKLAEEHGSEACISKTPSFEYWDEMPSKTKIDSMSEYLEDVSTSISWPRQRFGRAIAKSIS